MNCNGTEYHHHIHDNTRKTMREIIPLKDVSLEKASIPSESVHCQDTGQELISAAWSDWDE